MAGGGAGRKDGAIILTNTSVIEEHGPHMGCGIDAYLGYQMCKLVKQNLEAKGIKSPGNIILPCLIGESFGGVLAAHYAAGYPEHVERMVLISPGELLFKEWDEETSGNIKDRALPETLQKLDEKLRTARIMFAYLLLEINPDTAHNFLSESQADTLLTKYISLLLGGMACDPKEFPEVHNLLFGFWATLIPDEFPPWK